MGHWQSTVESLEISMFADVYRNRRVLLTGHTGFKGSWLALWLQSLGAQVTGLALEPNTEPNHWNLLHTGIPELRVDICDQEAVAAAVKKANPEIVFHLAAQSLVRLSYSMPVETWKTNVMGSVNLLEACRNAPDLKAIVFITTDKCYENKEATKGYSEEDRLGGHDPYSASKASTEFVAASYRDSFFKGSPLIASARAGNVIGGGDWALDRIIPDLARAWAKGEDLIVRSPNAVRPWQHVLEPLSGYLQLGQKLLEGNKEFEGAWNFGPDQEGVLSVADLLSRMNAKYVVQSDKNAPHETKILLLDSGKARNTLKWAPVWDMDEQIQMTAEWYDAFRKDKKVLSTRQLEDYQAAAKQVKASWV